MRLHHVSEKKPGCVVMEDEAVVAVAARGSQARVVGGRCPKEGTPRWTDKQEVCSAGIRAVYSRRREQCVQRP